MQIISNEIVESASKYNEAEVRFHIIDPVLRKLGYPDHEDVYLKLEEKLEYPYLHIGRRSNKDVPVGYPDYRAGLKGARGSFTVEAKGGSVSIAVREVEQAHSYAAHAQVGANYFVLCNGSMICIYQTLSGPTAPALTTIPIGEINQRFHELENILAPKNLAKNCRVSHDMALKLADGLGSATAIRSGQYCMSGWDYRILSGEQDVTALFRQNLPQLSALDEQLELLKTAFELRVSGGVVERTADGLIKAHVKFAGVTIHNQQAMAIIGISEATFVTADRFISIDPASPTIFESLKDFTVPRGTILPHMFGEASRVEGEIVGNMFIKAAMHYQAGKLHGQYITLSDQRFSLPDGSSLLMEMDVSGAFELNLEE